MINFKKEKFYITTAIPYINAPPHLGHILEFTQTDAIARFNKLLGKDIFLVTGSDENSLKNVRTAEEIGVKTQELCDKNSRIFKEVAISFGLCFNKFIRSSDKNEHWPGVWKLWNLCKEAGDIYLKKYKGLYCVGCEAFYTKEELTNGVCPEHGTEPEIVEEENYFFRLSKYQDELRNIIEKGKLKIIPEFRKNEVLSFIDGGLEDFSISRSRERAKGWGIPVPGDETQIIYVWFDALSVYLTGIGFGIDEEKFKKWWPADVHVIGKGITRFHAIYWPAILLSSGLELPKNIFIHGYITIEGQKMSKSLGNIIDPRELIKKYNVDFIRYFLLNEISQFEDGDFSEKRLIEKVNNELIANFGNFAYRVLSFLKNNFNSKVPEHGEIKDQEKEIIEKVEKIKETVKRYMEEFKITDALREIISLSKIGNQYFQSKKPWETFKENIEDCKTTLFISTNLVRALAILLSPFIPFSCEKLWKQLNLKESVHEQKFDSIDKFEIKPYHEIGEIEPLFKKLEVV
ncbi:MAG: methionine--tRNA ligase [Candidatus Aenigmatarchaeota archaeon]